MDSGNEAVLNFLQAAPECRFSHLLPTFSQDEQYPPLGPFNHINPGSRTLTAFLANAVGTDLTLGF